MATTESLIFDIVTRDRASEGLSKVGSTARDAAGNVDSLTRRLDEVGRKTATARLALAGDKEAQASLDRIDAKIVSLDRRTASPNVTVEGAARATAEISAIDLELDKLGKSGSGASSSLGGLSGPGGMMALVGAGVLLSPVLVTTATGLAGLAAAAYGTISPILAAGTATAAQKQALADLDPAQQAAYASLGALKDQFGGFSKSLEPEVLGVFNQGLKLAGGLLHDVQPVAAATGKGLESVVGAIAANLKTQQWQQFFSWMAQNAGPDIQQLGTLFIDLTNDLPPLLELLQPVASAFLTLADNGAKAIGVLAAINPAVDGNAQAAARAAQANTGFWGSIVKWADNGKAVTAQVLGMKQAGDQVGGAMQTAGVNAKSAGDAIAAAGGNASVAAPQVGTLAGDMALLNSNTTLATDATKAFNDMWQQFVGKSVSDQQAVLNAAAAFDAYTTSLQTNKANSTVAQQAFLAIITTMGSGLSTLQQNGATVGQLNSYYQTNIDKLNALHGLTPQQRADIQGITRDYDTWANSTAGLTGQTQAAAAALRNDFLSQIGSVAASAPGVKQGVSDLADAIFKTGTQSSATRGDRQQLIDDLVATGMKADAARGLVNALQAQISGLTGKTVAINLTSNAPPGSAARAFLGFAAGGRVTGGVPGRDSVLGLLMPGEVVVPAPMVAAGAVDHLKGSLPGFAAGGLVAYGGAGAPESVIPASRAGGGGGTMTIVVKVDPVVAAVTPDRNLGRQIAQHVTAFIIGGGHIYPAGTAPR